MDHSVSVAHVAAIAKSTATVIVRAASGASTVQSMAGLLCAHVASGAIYALSTGEGACVDVASDASCVQNALVVAGVFATSTRSAGTSANECSQPSDAQADGEPVGEPVEQPVAVTPPLNA